MYKPCKSIAKYMHPTLIGHMIDVTNIDVVDILESFYVSDGFRNSMIMSICGNIVKYYKLLNTKLPVNMYYLFFRLLLAWIDPDCVTSTSITASSDHFCESTARNRHFCRPLDTPCLRPYILYTVYFK